MPVEMCDIHNRPRPECGFWLGPYAHGESPDSTTRITTAPTREGHPLEPLKVGVERILVDHGLNKEHLPKATEQIIALVQQFNGKG